MPNETPEQNRERLLEMSRQEREGFAKASEGQLIANTGEELTEEDLAAREERLAPLSGRPFGSQSYTDRTGEALDREAASVQDEPNRPAYSGSEKRANINEQHRQYAEASSGAGSGKAGSSRSRKSSEA